MNRLLYSAFGMPIVICCLAPSVSAQDNYAQVKIKSTKVADHIYMLEGRGGNLGVSIGDDGTLLVDDQYAPLAERILKAIEKLGGKEPKFILNTHWHGDHTGGNEFFGETGTIIAQDNVRKRLSTMQELFGRKVEPLSHDGLPMITFDDSLHIYFNGEEIRILHLPHGHTDGDCVIFFTKSNVVHMGDLMFMGMYPFIDLDHGGDVEGVIRNVKTVLDQLHPDVKVIPGHGPLSSYEDIITYRQMLIESVAVVRDAIKLGKSLDEVKKLQPPEKWKSWSNGFIKTDRWMETIYKSLSRT